MLTLLLHVCAISSVSAYVVGGRVFTPKLRGSAVTMAAVPKGMKPGQDYDSPALTKENKIPGWGVWKGRIKQETAEQTRQNKLVTGTNWAPRTYPKKGEGYFFFQGPTPKTAYQEDLPSFFSAENFVDMQIKPQQIIVAITGFVSGAVLLFALLSPTGISAPALNVQLAAPDLVKQKKEPAKTPPAKTPPAKKDPAAEKAERAAAKAAADEKKPLTEETGPEGALTSREEEKKRDDCCSLQ